MLHNHVPEIRHSLPETTDALFGFNVDIAVVKPGQTRKAESIQTSENEFETSSTKDR